jgi:hypothetical protein
MLKQEETYLIPAIAKWIPESDQKSLNDRVIRKLGILDSRLHLVGMHEAVWDIGSARDRQLFDQVIPMIPRKMVPRWRRTLYEPRCKSLEQAQ